MQTYQDINVIILDDCSDDDYSDILANYSSILNIKYIKSDINQGAGITRNIGIDNSNSKYLLFCDSDDTFLNSIAIEKMIKDIESDDYDFCSYGFVQEKLDLNFSSSGCNATWIFGKLYKRSFLDKYDIRFPNETHNEDVCFNQVCYALADKVYKTEETYYLHHINENSITKTDSFSKDDKNSFVRNYIGSFNFVKSKAELTDKIKWQFLEGFIILYHFYTEAIQTKNKEYCNSFYDLIVDYYSSLYDFAPEFICDENFKEHYFKIYKVHSIHNKSLICTLDWYTFINKIDKSFREANTSLF